MLSAQVASPNFPRAISRPRIARLGSAWAVALLLLLGVRGAAKDIAVPQDFPAIQYALDNAQDGDRVLVGPGTYRETLNFNGRDITLLSVAGPLVTLLDPEMRRGVEIGPKGALIGFTITNTFADFGSGMAVHGLGSIIRSNIFDHCVQSAGGYGAAIGGNTASPIIEANVFRYCSADDQFLSGVLGFVNSSSPVIQNNLFFSNSCVAINLTLPEGNQPRVLNNTIAYNRVGLHIDARVPVSSQVFRNNILVGNGTGVDVLFTSGPLIAVWDHNLVFGNGTDYAGVPPLTGKSGNVSVDPLFYDVASANFKLRRVSPAIDAGTVTGAPPVDISGAQRPVDGNGDGVAGFDLGAFEYIPAPPSPPVMLSGLSDVHSVHLEWSPVPDTIRYIVQRGEAPDGPFVVVSPLELSATHFTDEAVEGGPVYYYTVAAVDPNGVSAPSMILRIVAGNRAPAPADDRIEISEDDQLLFQPLLNDTDPDGDLLTVTHFTQPPNAKVLLLPSGQLRVIPAPNFHGTNQFTYTVADGRGKSAEAMITLVVLSVHDAPQANRIFSSVAGDEPLHLSLSGQSIEGLPLTFEITTPPNRGRLDSFNPTTGQVSYRPYLGARGPDSFEFRVSDGISNSPPAIVALQIVQPVDADADGLPDSWERRFDVNNPGDDRDHDGLTNYQEYLASTDPRDTQSYLHLLGIEPTAEGRLRIRWSSVGGIRYRVQISEDITGGFRDLPRPADVEVEPAPLGVPSTMSYEDPSPTTGLRLYRVRTVNSP